MAKKTYDLTNCYTARQASAVLGLSIKRVRQLPKEGKLKQYRGEGGLVLFDQVEVNALRVERQALGRTSLPRSQRDSETLDEVKKLIELLQENTRRSLEMITEANKLAEESLYKIINEQRAEIDRLRARRPIFGRGK
jgi:hypothetical protein